MHILKEYASWSDIKLQKSVKLPAIKEIRFVGKSRRRTRQFYIFLRRVWLSKRYFWIDYFVRIETVRFLSCVRYGTTRSDLMINSEGDCYGKISQKNFVVCSITNVPLPFNFEILEFANGFRPPPNLLIFENIYGFRLKNSILAKNNNQTSIFTRNIHFST